jgi:hypothetical protein
MQSSQQNNPQTQEEGGETPSSRHNDWPTESEIEFIHKMHKKNKLGMYIKGFQNRVIFNDGNGTRIDRDRIWDEINKITGGAYADAKSEG